jgi:hypothetical protein
MIVERRPPRYPRRGPSCLLFVLPWPASFSAFGYSKCRSGARHHYPHAYAGADPLGGRICLLAELSEQDGDLAEATGYYETAINLDPSGRNYIFG